MRETQFPFWNISRFYPFAEHVLGNSLQRIKISFIFVVAAATCGRAIETFPLCGLRLPAQSLEMKGFEISVISTFKQNGGCRRSLPLMGCRDNEDSRPGEISSSGLGRPGYIMDANDNRDD